MSPSSKDYEVGYMRTPKATRWKEGQCGNPARQYRTRPLSEIEMIDKHLLRPIDVVKKGERKKVPALEVIVLKLWQQELAGSRRALSVRLKYEAIAQEAAERGVDVELVE